MKISIIIPAYNEENSVERLCSEIQDALQGIIHEVIIIDDASTDSTLQKLQQLSLQYANLKVLRNSQNSGIVKSWKKGLSECKYEIACLIDADLQIKPIDIRKLLSKFDPLIDMVVQGARQHVGRKEKHRDLLSKTLNIILNTVFSQKSADSKSGFVLTQVSILQEFCDRFCDFKYGQTFLGVWLRKNVPIVSEVRVRFYPRISGKSFISKWRTPFIIAMVLQEVNHVLFNSGKYFTDFLGLYRENYVRLNRNSVGKKIYFWTLALHSWNLNNRTGYLYKLLRNIEYENLSLYKSIQAKRLRRLLSISKHSSPHYKKILSNIDVTQINTENYLEILASVPCLEKGMIRKNGDLILNENSDLNANVQISTSGSTGEPLRIVVDKFQLSVRFASSFRALEGIGWNLGERQMRLWHQTLGMSTSQKIKERINAIVLRRLFIPAFKIDEAKVQRLVHKVNKFKPRIIEGYAESLNMISLFSKSKSVWSPKAILSSAQELTDSTRDNIERIFQTKVLNKYGAREFSGIAYECTSQKGMHVLMESYIVEILKNGRHAEPGETGEVFITDLNNSVFPMIRYRIGDLASVSSNFGKCACGRYTTRITKIVGRTQGLIVGMNGVLVPGTFFSHLFKDFSDYIASYQIYQNAKSQITLRLIPTLSYDENMSATLISLLRRTLGDQTEIDIDIVADIPLGATGKRQSVVSELYSDFQNMGTQRLVV